MTDGRRERARRAYERGRWRDAAPWALPAALLAGVAWAAGADEAPLCGLALGALLVGLRWRGGELGTAAVAGLAAGMVPYTLVLGWGCYGSCAPALCLGVAGLGGLLGGGLLARSIGPRHAAVAAGIGVAAAVASLSCPLLGAPGLMVVPALAIGAAPLAWRAAT